MSHVLAPAKINLRLEVLGKRPDGYHELRTWMLALDLFDRVSVRRSSVAGVRVELSGPMASADVPRDEQNLAARAVALGLERARELGLAAPTGAVVELVKHVPSQAGLGGASADAAAALAALEDLLEHDLGAHFRTTLLAGLGSDCTFFERARATGCALCTGRGEEVEVLAAPPDTWRVLVLTPEMRSPTAAVYARQASDLSRNPTGPKTWERSPLGLRDWIVNDLEAAARLAVPDLGTWLDALNPARGSVPQTAPVFTLSGSGSSAFSLFESEAQARLAQTAARGIRTPLRGSWILKPARAALLRIFQKRDVE